MNTTFTTITLSKETAEKLKQLAKSKGVSQGVFVQNMVGFFIDNNIDYSNSEPLISGVVNKRTEAIIKILRAYEKTYFKDSNSKLNMLYDNLMGAIGEATKYSQEMAQTSDPEMLGIQSELQTTTSELQKLKMSAQLVCRNMEALIQRAREKNRMYIIEVEKEVYNSVVLNKETLQKQL